MYGGLATARSNVVPRGRASNHEPMAMRTLRPRRPSPARLARATSMASALDVGEPHGDPVQRQLVGERQADRSRPGAEVGDRQRPRHRARQLDGDAGDDLGLRPRDQHPPVDGEVEVAEAPMAEHVRQRLAGEMTLDHRVEMGDHASVGLVERRRFELVGAARLLAQPAGDGIADRSRVRRCMPRQSAPPRHSSSPASCRVRSSAARAATTSSRSPASTSARR